MVRPKRPAECILPKKKSRETPAEETATIAFLFRFSLFVEERKQNEEEEENRKPNQKQKKIK